MKNRQKRLTDEQMGTRGALLPPLRQRPDPVRSTASFQPSLFRRHLVDSPDRRGMPIFARQVSFTLHLLAAAQAMERRRRVAECVAYVTGSAGPRRLLKWDGPSRRHLRPSEKGGAAVGKTKRGKATKWMVPVDGEGLRLGVRLESASPTDEVELNVNTPEFSPDFVRVAVVGNRAVEFAYDGADAAGYCVCGGTAREWAA